MNAKRKLICAAIVALSAILLVMIVVFNFEDRGASVPSLKMSEDEINEIITTREETDERLETGLRFNGTELPYDYAGRCYYYSLPENTESAYVPDVSVSGGVGIAFESDRITDEQIAAGEPLTAIVYSKSKYCRINIVCTTLPLISISTGGAEIGLDYTNMVMTVYDNRSDATRPVSFFSGKIHTRGQTSIRFDKKAYRITLTDTSPGRNRRELDVSLLGMRKDGDWILYAAYNDQERVRNVFCTNLWHDSCASHNSFGVDNGVEYRFTEVLVNGEYAGLYALGYPLDKKQLRLTEGEYTFQKASAKKELTLNYSDQQELASNFIIKNGDEYAGDDVIWKNLADYYKYLQSVDGADPELRTRCDIAAATDVLLFTNLIQGMDNVSSWSTLNLFQTMKIRDGSAVMLYSPWDMDQTFGNIWSFTMDNWISPYGVKPEQNRVMKANPAYLLMLYGDEDAVSRTKERYRVLRQGKWSEDNLNSLIDRYEKDIFDSGAYGRDVERWPGSTKLEDPSVKLSLFREYVLERLTYMDSYVDGLSADGMYEHYEVYGR